MSRSYLNSLRTIIDNNVITKYVIHKNTIPTLDSSRFYSFNI